MFVDQYTKVYVIVVRPWITFDLLVIIICVSLLQEGMADLKWLTSDLKTNYHLCVVLRRARDVGPNKRIENGFRMVHIS